MAENSSLNAGSFVGDILNFIPNMVFSGLNYDSQKKWNKEQLRQADLNRQMQYDFAQNGISWRVQDAKNAGLHPLYALGANTPTYTPSSLDTQAPQFHNTPQLNADKWMLSENQKLQNELLKSQIEAQKIANMKALDKGVESNGGISSQVVSPSRVGNGATIQGQGIETPADMKEVLKERRSDKNMSVYDYASGSIPKDRETDSVLSATSGTLHTVPKGETFIKENIRMNKAKLYENYQMEKHIREAERKGQLSPSEANTIRKFIKGLDIPN